MGRGGRCCKSLAGDSTTKFGPLAAISKKFISVHNNTDNKLVGFGRWSQIGTNGFTLEPHFGPGNTPWRTNQPPFAPDPEIPMNSVPAALYGTHRPEITLYPRDPHGVRGEYGFDGGERWGTRGCRWVDRAVHVEREPDHGGGLEVFSELAAGLGVGVAYRDLTTCSGEWGQMIMVTTGEGLELSVGIGYTTVSALQAAEVAAR